jgi:hypothetical protein
MIPTPKNPGKFSTESSCNNKYLGSIGYRSIKDAYAWKEDQFSFQLRVICLVFVSAIETECLIIRHVLIESKLLRVS